MATAAQFPVRSHCVLLTIRDALTTLDPARWDDLAMQASEANSFQERWFLSASLAHIETPESLRIAVVYGADGQLDGVLPLCFATHYGRLRLTHMTNWQHHNAFLGTPLVRAGRESQFWLAVIAVLDASPWAVGLLRLTDLTENGPVQLGLDAAMHDLGRTSDTIFRKERAVLASDLSPAAYFETTVRKKKRKEIKRLQSRLAELGVVTFETIRDPAEAASACDAFLTLERSGWKGDRGSALDSDAGTRNFFAAIIHDGLLAGRVEILKLSLEERPLAMLVNFIALPGSFSFKIAYDEEFARFSPGVLIQLENYEILARDGFGWMDSCAVEDHPMINSLWAERRVIIWKAVSLAGVKRNLIFKATRLAENSWTALKKYRGGKRAPANDNRIETDD
jgi:CelD/BcsL family acetyltransferase involved in cellulose biosynthesis